MPSLSGSAEFIDENGGGPGVRLLKAAPEEGLGPTENWRGLASSANDETNPI